MESLAKQNELNVLLGNVGNFVNTVESLEIENAAAIRSREKLEKTLEELMEQNRLDKESLDIATHAIEILRNVSDEAVGKAYRFLEESLNKSLKKMFKNTTRQIEIREYTRGGQYPQLEIALIVGNNTTRSLKSDSGHGIAQIVSLLCVLSLIVITGSRRILVMDEILSGVSVDNRKVVSDILWTFTQIGFQFIVNEHGFVPKGASVYHLEMVGDVSGVKKHYVEEKGVYLQGSYESEKEKLPSLGGTDYSEEENEEANIENTVTNSAEYQTNNVTEDTAEDDIISI